MANLPDGGNFFVPGQFMFQYEGNVWELQFEYPTADGGVDYADVRCIRLGNPSENAADPNLAGLNLMSYLKEKLEADFDITVTLNSQYHLEETQVTETEF